MLGCMKKRTRQTCAVIFGAQCTFKHWLRTAGSETNVSATHSRSSSCSLRALRTSSMRRCNESSSTCC
jgi:hypothetical protein